MIADDVIELIKTNAALLDSTLIYDRDFSYDFFGFKTLERSYLLRMEGKIAERPQHMLMRVAVGIHKDDIDAAIATYQGMSKRAVHPCHTHTVQCRNTKATDVQLLPFADARR